MDDLLNIVAKRATRYRQDLSTRSVAPHPAAIEELAQLDVALPEHPTDPTMVVEILDRIGSPATVASAGGRYFGFVVGGSLPAALAANWLAGAWDQNALCSTTSPVAVRLGGDLASLAVGTSPSACWMWGRVRHWSNDG